MATMWISRLHLTWYSRKLVILFFEYYLPSYESDMILFQPYIHIVHYFILIYLFFSFSSSSQLEWTNLHLVYWVQSRTIYFTSLFSLLSLLCLSLIHSDARSGVYLMPERFILIFDAQKVMFMCLTGWITNCGWPYFPLHTQSIHLDSAVLGKIIDPWDQCRVVGPWYYRAPSPHYRWDGSVYDHP